jgi:predicted MPP superfamily phosphohydrolase
MMRLAAEGRGTGYTWKRGVLESILRIAYARPWPAAAWGAWPAAPRVRVVRHRVTRHAPRLRLAFVSDLHLGPTTASATLDAAFAQLAAARPDALLLGGDYVFLEATPEKARELEQRVASVPARVKLAVLGNHDLWARHARLERALERAGARVLVDECARLPTPHEDVAVVGLDDPWTGRRDPARAFSARRGAAFTIALCHSPDGLPWIAGRGVDLFVCGHTHGGQIALPGRPLYVPGRMGRRYPAGIFRVHDADVIVSRGVGATELPVRAFAPPDVVIVDIG